MTQRAPGRRSVAWKKDDPIGAEFAAVEFGDGCMSATGVAIGSDPEPYRLDYALQTGAGFLTSLVVLTARGDGWTRHLELTRGGHSWHADVTQEGDLALPDAGGDLAAFDAALDPDLGLSPLFNTMPVRRHRIHEGRTAGDFLMVWISVPDLSLHLSPQRYTYLERSAEDERIVRFEAMGAGEDFVADVVFDPEGLVVDYPGIAERLRSDRGSACTSH